MIAVGINPVRSHVGLFYTREGEVRFCDFQTERRLVDRAPDAGYYWIGVDLDPEEVSLVGSTLRQVYRLHPDDLPYSFRYTPRAFDATGQLMTDGAGFTCATFIIAVLEAAEFRVANLVTWPSRPVLEEELRELLLGQGHPMEVIARLKNERIEFRLLPIELCGAVASKPYPVDFEPARTTADAIQAAIIASDAANNRS